MSEGDGAAHKAGALAVPVWTLVRAVPYWPWHLEGEDCLWYPTMRPFRQSQRGEWADVVERLATALAEHG